MAAYATQMDAAKQGILTPEMETVAKEEHLEPELIRQRVAKGTICIPANIHHKSLHPYGIGEGLRTKMNVNLGISGDCHDYTAEFEKVKLAIQFQCEAIMDLSNYGKTHTFRKQLIEMSPAMIGTVPMYDAIGYLEKDLNEAEVLLKEVEEKGMNDEFFSYRQNRLNYWAVLALKARFYLWIQDKSQAAEYAGRVIANKDFRLNQGTDFAAKDNIASPEHLFSLHVYNLNDIVSNYFLNAGGVEQDQDKVKTDIFESDVTDYRVTYLWNEITEKSGTRYILEKYKQEGMPDAGLQEVPLIRLYEMYLIAIECSDLETEYKPLVDELVAARNISVVNVSTVDLKNAFVAKEYQKEFYGEGQQFFQAKRRGDKTILWTDIEGSKAVYVLPLPKSEIKFE